MNFGYGFTSITLGLATYRVEASWNFWSNRGLNRSFLS